MEQTVYFDAWCDVFSPIKNHLVADTSFNGCLFETYGQELDYVKSVPVAHIWTLIDGDDGHLVVNAGFKYVNRIGFFITEKPWDEWTHDVVVALEGGD